jgi:Protein SCAI
MSSSSSSSSPPKEQSHANDEKPKHIRVAEEFEQVLAYAQSLLDGLRKLAKFSDHWRAHFAETSSSFAAVWRYQQEHRSELERRDGYALERWHIGEIASKIGQLYYHYYLWTSELRCLCEAQVFYAAIRSRRYFGSLQSLDSLSVGKLVQMMRYFARYIVVSLLLDDLETVRELTAELSDIFSRFESVRPDSRQWRFVLDEIARFVHAQNMVRIDSNVGGEPTPPTTTRSATSNDDAIRFLNAVTHRLGFGERHRVAIDALTNVLGDEWPADLPPPRVQHALLVGNTRHQVKFSELTLDSFRIMHVLESTLPTDEQQRNAADDIVNPRKHLLYRPSLSLLLSTLSQAHHDMQVSRAPHNILMLYVSADGFKIDQQQHVKATASSSASSLSAASSDTATASPPLPSGNSSAAASSSPVSSIAATSGSPRRQRQTLGGVSMTPPATRLPMAMAASQKLLGGASAEPQDCFGPADLLPFLRLPFFLIADSDNSSAFRSVRGAYDKPFVALLSPESQPQELRDLSHFGNLFTAFLFDPIAALCFVADKPSLHYEQYTHARHLLDAAAAEIVALMASSDKVPHAFKYMLADASLRLLIVRFLFCFTALSLHRLFRANRLFLPQCHPSLSPSILYHPLLHQLVQSIATAFDINQHFIFHHQQV